jgi:hypothetical protein
MIVYAPRGTKYTTEGGVPAVVPRHVAGWTIRGDRGHHEIGQPISARRSVVDHAVT